MSYELRILKRVQKQLADLPAGDYEHVRDAIRALGNNPRPPGCQKLVSRDGWRIRAGSYRVIFEIDDRNRVVTVIAVGHRRDVYT